MFEPALSLLILTSKKFPSRKKAESYKKQTPGSQGGVACRA